MYMGNIEEEGEGGREREITCTYVTYKEQLNVQLYIMSRVLLLCTLDYVYNWKMS